MMNSEFDKQLKKAITAEHRKEQKEYLSSLERSLVEQEKPSQRFRWLKVASIAIVIGLSGYLILDSQPLTETELYNKYYAPYENVVEPIVRDRVTFTPKAQAFAQYERGDFREAIESFSQITPKDSVDKVTLLFYKANAYLQLKEYKKAKELLIWVKSNAFEEWKEESLWYLALVSLKLKEKEAAIKYLYELQKQKGQAYKSKQIKELLKELN